MFTELNLPGFCLLCSFITSFFCQLETLNSKGTGIHLSVSIYLFLTEMHFRLNFLSVFFLLAHSQTTNISLLREKEFKEFSLKIRGEVIFSLLSGYISIARKMQFACPPGVVGMSIATVPATFQQKHPKAESFPDSFQGYQQVTAALLHPGPSEPQHAQRDSRQVQWLARERSLDSVNERTT